jgi:helix-turn-helix domain-containing protein
MNIQDKIRLLREQNEWTQEEMAERMEMSKNGYAKIERGESKLSLERLEKLASVLGVDIIELICREKSFVYWGDHSNNTNYYGNNDALVYEIERLKLIVSQKEEMLLQKNSEIETLKNLVSVLQNK